MVLAAVAVVEETNTLAVVQKVDPVRDKVVEEVMELDERNKGKNETV